MKKIISYRKIKLKKIDQEKWRAIFKDVFGNKQLAGDLILEPSWKYKRSENE